MIKDRDHHHVATVAHDQIQEISFLQMTLIVETEDRITMTEDPTHAQDIATIPVRENLTDENLDTEEEVKDTETDRTQVLEDRNHERTIEIIRSINETEEIIVAPVEIKEKAKEKTAEKKMDTEDALGVMTGQEQLVVHIHAM